MTQQAQRDTESALTPEVRAMIGVEGEVIESWGHVDEEYLRRFTQAVMDPDPRYWDREFAEGTKFGGVIAPPIMVSYMVGRHRPEQEDPITRAFKENPESDGIGSVERPGALPPVPTHLVRVLNAGQRAGDLQVPQHRGQGLFPEPLLGHPRAFRPRRAGLPDHYRRDQLHQPGWRPALHHAAVLHPALAQLPCRGAQLCALDRRNRRRRKCDDGGRTAVRPYLNQLDQSPEKRQER